MTRFQKISLFFLLALIIVSLLYPTYVKRSISFIASEAVGFIGQSYGLPEKGLSEKTQRVLEDKKNEEEEVITSVAKLKEVSDFGNLVNKNGRSKLSITIIKHPTNRDPYYVVKVFEDFSDHTVTFGFYRYDSKTGKLFKQETSNETWIIVN